VLGQSGAYPPLFWRQLIMVFPLLTEVYLFGPLIAKRRVAGMQL
jgi:hypothetical protein